MPEQKNPDAGVMESINEKLKTIAEKLEKTQIAEYVELLNRPGRIIFTNLYAGIARGVGIAIGFTFFAAAIVYFLRLLGALNLPIIGDFIADIVKIVQVQLEGRAY